MKKLFFLILLPLAALVAGPVVTLTDDFNCYVDGVNFGQPADVIANNPKLAPAVNLAMQAHHAKVQSDAATAIKAAQDAATAAVAAAQADAAKKISDAQSAADAAAADAAQKIADAQDAAAASEAARAAEANRTADVVSALQAANLISPLPPKVVTAMQTESDKQKAALIAQKAAIDAQLAKLP